MVKFERFKLPNGLTLLVNEDLTTPLVSINILYAVGSRDEHPEKTGFAHLFEHLMFGGSVNIPSYDEPLQMVGGENNAFTTNDITNYYITLPSDNIETGLWLESDRMLALNFSEQSLKTQQSVVIEEFRQRYLNQPYGDVWLLLRPLAFKVHPYRWPTIGEKIDHIRDASLADVESFFYSHYAPNNAFMAISGNIETEEAYRLVLKWFGDIKRRDVKPRQLPKEPVQTEARSLTVKRKVAYDALYKAWHIPGRMEKGFYACDLITDLLSGGRSARLYQTLVKEKKLFSEINAYVSGDADPGLLIVGGKVMDGISIDTANLAVEKVLQEIIDKPVATRELKKVQNKFEANLLLGQINALNKAMSLSYYEMLGDAAMLNREVANYCKVTPKMIRETASDIFKPTNCSTLFYLADK
ncbi:MAG: pitrilysin family protein [Bacteroidota bacterium]|nr:pitrilysin family protein [Bacteroidota bacterium]